ncbi:protoheme IX farnesyltransferase [Oleidesulfovibrio sp.]|uniref:protoheme IX farnesyltransferase n=1 Tax=Oleidesulfovibrio sp. TaxID=2909707 RepID=UPI003A8AFDF5
MIRGYLPLFRIKVAFMVATSTAFGYLLQAGTVDWRLWVCSLATFTLTCCCSVFNQIQERELDARMPRTCQRPVAKGLLTPAAALIPGIVLLLASAGLLHASGGITLLGMGAFVIITYNGLYTPLKRISSFSLLTGAVPGALPPAFGWVAAGGSVFSPQLVIVTMVYYLWQVPHFWLRAEKDRAAYAEQGLPLPSIQLATRFSPLLNLWYSSYLTALLLIPLFPFMHSAVLRVGICFTVIAAFMVTGIILRSPERGFHIINASMLSVMLLLVADRLIGGSLIF